MFIKCLTIKRLDHERGIVDLIYVVFVTLYIYIAILNSILSLSWPHIKLGHKKNIDGHASIFEKVHMSLKCQLYKRSTRNHHLLGYRIKLSVPIVMSIFI